MTREVSNPYDFLKLFDGLDEKQIRARMKRVLEILAEEEQENNDMSQGIIDAMRGTMPTKEWQDANKPAPAPFDRAAAEAQATKLYEEYEILSRNPAQNWARMEQIGKDVAALQADIEKAGADTAKAWQEQHAGELETLHGDIATISSEMEELTKNPAANYARMTQLQGELDKRQARLDVIANGGEQSQLNWKG